jgi:hypothetical protein
MMESSGEKPPERPWWVSMGLWGLPNRASVLACIWLSLLFGGAGLVAGLWKRGFFLLGFIALGAPGYWAILDWADRHEVWTKK